jgi:hypothetical protein
MDDAKAAGERFAQFVHLQQSLYSAQEGLTSKLVDETMRFRAWESLLYLFFARYYIDKPDPMAAIEYDRDFLANLRRDIAQDEDGAKQIEALFDVITTMVEQGQKLQAWRDLKKR